MVLDLIDVALTSEIKKLPGKVSADNLYIRALRVGQFKLGVLRLVLDLKSEVKPQAFILKPVGDYGHRLVLDIYPTSPPDPLMTLINEGAIKAIVSEVGNEIPIQLGGGIRNLDTVEKKDPGHLTLNNSKS